MKSTIKTLDSIARVFGWFIALIVIVSMGGGKP